jgi:recombination protein RecA|tara:strand:- start:15407 stop:16510 length:1104 start_codon:yes stop_codon:yes gene_type:complete
MAKKKITKFENDVTSNTVISTYGDVVRHGTEVLANLTSLDILSVSPALDIALGGGIREGSCVVMSGDPKTGKTTTALHFAGKCQQLGKKVIYVNTEGRLAIQNFEGIKSLNAETIIVVESTDDRVLSAEDYLNIIEYYINNDPECVIVVDSISSMVPKDELEGLIRTGVRNALPRLLSMFLKRIGGQVTKNKTVALFILHNIANTGGSKWSPAKMTDGGNMIQYQAGTNIAITHRGRWQVPKDTGPHIGQVANWKVLTSNAGGTPNSTAEGWIRYGIGVDETQEIIQIACEFRLVKAAGAWYTIDCALREKGHPSVAEVLKNNNIDAENDDEVEKFFKFQGINNLSEFLNDNPSITELIYKNLKELF